MAWAQMAACRACDALEEFRDGGHAKLGRALALGPVPVEDAQQRLVVTAVERPADDAAVLIDLRRRKATRAGHETVSRVSANARAVEGRRGAP